MKYIYVLSGQGGKHVWYFTTLKAAKKAGQMIDVGEDNTIHIVRHPRGLVALYEIAAQKKTYKLTDTIWEK